MDVTVEAVEGTGHQPKGALGGVVVAASADPALEPPPGVLQQGPVTVGGPAHLDRGPVTVSAGIGGQALDGRHQVGHAAQCRTRGPAPTHLGGSAGALRSTVMQELGGRVAVITGGGSGIGLATGEALAREGMDVLLADIEESALATAADQVGAHGGRVATAVCDVADREAVEALAEQAWSELGGCHVLFNNAGVAVFGPIQEMTHDDWRWVIDVDLWGVIHGVESFVPRMLDQGEGGHVVSTASFAGLVPNDGLGVYCVAKYGVVALSECLRRDLKPHGMSASVLCPMRVATNIDASDRNRTPDYGGPGHHGAADPPDEDDYEGRLVEVGPVADLVVRGIKADELYLLPHAESERFVRNRFERILGAYERLPGV